MTKSTAELIEFLCNRKHPDLQSVQPERVHALSAMSVPTPGLENTANGYVTSRGRSISPEEQGIILQKAAVFKDELTAKSPEEIESLYQNAVLTDWRSDKLTVDRAAATIANRIFPDDGYDFTVEQRQDCEGAQPRMNGSLHVQPKVAHSTPRRRRDAIATNIDLPR